MPAIIGPTDVNTSSPATTPVGPKPGVPRNVSMEKMAQGWVISWLPPLNTSVVVAYYRIEFKEEDNRWQYSEPIAKDTAYLVKNLEVGTKYTFRVWAYSILGNGEVSEPLEYRIPGAGDGIKGARAITAGIVGSVLFFVTAIVLSVCIVKICNKRKRRQMEKAYMMVTCPVMDGMNGGHHSHGDSPVPLKQYVLREAFSSSKKVFPFRKDSVHNTFNDDQLSPDMWPDVIVHPLEFSQLKRLEPIGEMTHTSRFHPLRDEEL
ncbi:unnamed protein product [Oppiella nova]|uniref:Fibronectin type-III domain-containing protein n=1 Tax=Oppiella nova TaxID=334625 RepID=A0A7R9M802_9ACAR|nr:unnamed protein product [Oppiella nova]CAG2172184.1 unnamed protein product [Oppiella nova]